MGAALSYYSVFSIGPLILIAVAVAGLVFGREAVQGQVTEFPERLAGRKRRAGDQRNAGQRRKAARGADRDGGRHRDADLRGDRRGRSAQGAFNTVWEVEEPKAGGIWGFVRTYVLSFAAVLAIGFLLIVSMVMTTALAARGRIRRLFCPGSGSAGHGLCGVFRDAVRSCSP